MIKPFIHWGFLGVQFITAVLAIRCWHKKKSFAWKVFTIIWPLTFLTELTGKIISSYRIENIWLYDIFDAVFYPGVLLLFLEVFSKKKFYAAAITSITVLIFLWQVIYLVIGDYSTIHTLHSIVASTAVILFSLVYLIQSSLDKESSTPLRTDYYYWFSSGFFIYFTFRAIMLGMYSTLLSSKVSWLPNFLFYANHLVTLVLHICLWAGFIATLKWMRPPAY